jgi:hypothetical protein
MPAPDNPVAFPEDLCPECAFLTFKLLQRLTLAYGQVVEALAEDEHVDWVEVLAVIDEARALALEVQVHHEALDHENDEEG